MRVQLILPLVAAGALIVPAGAQADRSHTVLAGESLSSIAAADHVSIHALAGANRLTADARLLIGAVLRIPPPGTGFRRPAAPPHAVPGGRPVPAHRATPGRHTAPTHGLPTRHILPAHSYSVAPGDTLTGLAARARISVSALATLNGLRPTALLITGTTLRLPGSAAPRHASRSPTHDHIVVTGDTLSALAARAGTTVNRLATLNGLRPTALLIAGTTLRLPGSAAPRHASRSPTHDHIVVTGDTLSALAARAGTTVNRLAALNHMRPTALLITGARLSLPGAAVRRAAAAAPAARPYVVAPGDTLTALATHSGITVGALAALNHLPADALLIAGATIELPATGASKGGPPYPTAERVTSSQVEQIAANNGVPPSLAAAIAWQESGFNNDLVSSADARGVMQILPGTWAWIQGNLTPGTPLAPASAIDNVRGGVLYLHALLAATNGNVRQALAGYIQGLASVHENGMYSVTRQYVSDVLTLRRFFGGH